MPNVRAWQSHAGWGAGLSSLNLPSLKIIGRNSAVGSFNVMHVLQPPYLHEPALNVIYYVTQHDLRLFYSFFCALFHHFIQRGARPVQYAEIGGFKSAIKLLSSQASWLNVYFLHNSSIPYTLVQLVYTLKNYVQPWQWLTNIFFSGVHNFVGLCCKDLVWIFSL